ncbi:MAG: hypothetical protein M5T52_19235 [Ignavibacteriaceae bacterium]|nr:hypothetical protein [Ignavibacteriaceae bacterium]
MTEARAEKWSDSEKNLLRELYPDRSNSIEDISKKLNRTRYGILQQSQVLGLSRPRHQHEWSKNERGYLLKNYKTKSYGEMAKDLGMTYSSIAHKISRLGLKVREKGRPWTEDEKEFIRQNYKKMPTKDIARKLNRTVNSIITVVGPLGVSNSRPRPWE